MTYLSFVTYNQNKFQQWLFTKMELEVVIHSNVISIISTAPIPEGEAKSDYNSSANSFNENDNRSYKY